MKPRKTRQKSLREASLTYCAIKRPCSRTATLETGAYAHVSSSAHWSIARHMSLCTGTRRSKRG
eukprot:720214-Pleurochrysis_carterae.AAC.3